MVEVFVNKKKKISNFNKTIDLMGRCYTKIRTYMVWKDDSNMLGEEWHRIANDYIKAFDWMERKGIPENVQSKMLEGIEQKLEYLEIRQDIADLLKEAKCFES